MEPDPSIGRVPQLGDYAAVLRARKWLVISITLLALVGAGTYLAVRTPVYSSSSEIQIFATDEGLGTTVDLETEARIADSLSVAGLALPKMGTTFASTEELLDHVSVSLPSDAAILMITFTHVNRGVAVQGAKAMADSYLEFKANQASQAVDSQRASLETQYQDFSDRAKVLRGIIANPPSIDDKLAAQTELAGVDNNLTDISARLLALENDQPPAGQPLGPPSTAKLASPGLPLVLIGAGILGLFLGSILAFIIEGLTGRVREAEEVEEELGSAVLGMVPVMHLKRARGRLPVVSRDAPSDPAAEAYRLLRSGFLYSAGSDERIVMVTSPGVGDGKSTTAANLAVALAQAGHRTILVGGDLRRSDLHTLFGIPNDTGLVHVLEGRSRPTPLPTDVENLRIVPSGPPTEISAHLFETEAFPEALAILREQAEYVVVDAPPLAISDPLLMVPSVDYVLFVVDAGKATRRALRRTRELLQRIGLPRMGVVLNRSKSPWGPSGTRAYYYYKKGKAAGVPTVAQEAAPEIAAPVAVVQPAPEAQPVAESQPAAAQPAAESQPAAEAQAKVESKAGADAQAKVESKAGADAQEKPESTEPVDSKPVPAVAESKPAESKPAESKPAGPKSEAEEKPQPKPAITPDTKSRPAAAAKTRPPTSTVATPDAAVAKAATPTAAPATPTPTAAQATPTAAPATPTAATAPAEAAPAAAPATPTPAAAPAEAAPAQQAPEPAVKAEPAATPVQPVTAPAEAVEATPVGSEVAPAAPPIPVETPTPVPPVPAADAPVPPVPATPSAPETPPVPGPAGEQASEPVTEVMPEPVIEPASRNGGRTSKRSGSRKRRSGSRGRSRPSGG